ncbi:unnamed protein product [Lota lota]
MAALLVAVLYFLSFQGLCSVYSVQYRELSTQQGEMVVLKCSCHGHGTAGANFTWTHHHPSETQRTWLSQGDSYGDSLLVHSGCLVVLSASVERQGNYSCTLGNSNSTSWFTLTVSPTRQDVDPDRTGCSHGKSCFLKCPDVLNISSLNFIRTVWQKDNVTQEDSFNGSFRSVAEEDGGVYTCRRLYQYRGRLYNHTRTIALKVKPNRFQDHSPTIMSPKMGEVYPVHLGSQLVVPCETVVYNAFDNVYWLYGKSFVKADQNLSVSYNTTEETKGRERKITVSLVFQKVTEDQLSGNYTCKLESTQKYSNVTISLALKALPVSYHMVAGLAVLFALLLVVSSSLVFFWCRVHITLVLRDKLGCHRNASDGKRYDAYVMTYKSHAYTALSEEDRRWMERVLEDQLGYRLCLQDRDVSPGEAMADAVMQCILQSRRVVLLPSSEDLPDLCFGLPSAIHSALVEKKSHLVLILTTQEVLVEQPKDGGSSSLPESLRLLTKAGNSVTWGGPCSRPLSSSFWKHLRYHLPAPRNLRAMQSALDSVC